MAIKWRSSKFRRLVLERGGKVRGNPCNAPLGLGANKRRGFLSMTERHLRTLPLKDVGRKVAKSNAKYHNTHVAVAFAEDENHESEKKDNGK